MAFRYEMTAAGVDSVRRVETDMSGPEPGQVQIRIRASSLNFHDFVTLSGFIPGIDYPRVPLSDGCGEITAVGEGVEGFAEGERALPLFYPQWLSGRPSKQNKGIILGENVDGCLQEYLNIDAASVVKAPSSLTDEQAATLNCAGLTAWYALMEEGQLTADKTVLIQGTGGVSLFALQFAKAVGATVVATSSSEEKLRQLREMGVDHLVNYKDNPDWEKQVMKLSGGVDLVIDVGGQTTLGRSVSCTKTDGFIAVIGVLSGFDAASVSVIDVMQKNLTIKGITVGCAESFKRMCAFVGQHAITPCISHTVNADNLAYGIELMQTRKHFGKIAIRVE
ncbi:MAG: NADPH:quinone reductase-like Zn-dependent oxidoreductase [Porticoccaceae bacterium]|jgi:NADPH:quinone reductase-like Zn-dependent oxidoreductase